MNSQVHITQDAFWFGTDPTTFKQARDTISPDSVRLQWERLDSQLTLPVGSIAILEIASSGTSDNRVSQYMGGVHDSSSSESVVHSFLSRSPNCVVICVGENVSAQSVADYLEEGVSFYVERSSLASRLEQKLDKATEISRQIRADAHRLDYLKKLWQSVTVREAAVLEMILDGIPNKTIATRLGVSQRTIEARRQKLYQKLASKSLPEVVKTICELQQLDEKFKLPPTVDFPKQPSLNGAESLEAPAFDEVEEDVAVS